MEKRGKEINKWLHYSALRYIMCVWSTRLKYWSDVPSYPNMYSTGLGCSALSYSTNPPRCALQTG